MVQGRGLGVVAVHVCVCLICLLVDYEVWCSEGPLFCGGKERSEIESTISMQWFMCLLPVEQSW